MNRTNKRFYWLKLPDDFFDRNDIKIIESQKNGEKYVLFYLKLLTAAIEHTGKLRFNESIPFTEEMLATITNTDIDVVRSSIKLFKNLDLIEIDGEQTIHMIEVPKMLGSETASTIRSRKSRAKKKKLSNVQEQKALQCNTYATNCNGELDIELDIEKDIEREYTDIDVEKDSKNLITLSLVENIFNNFSFKNFKPKEFYEFYKSKGFKLSNGELINKEVIKTLMHNWEKELEPITLEIVKDVYDKNDFKKFNPERFYNYYQAVGWKFNNGNKIRVNVLPNLMKNWEISERSFTKEQDVNKPDWLDEYVQELEKIESEA